MKKSVGAMRYLNPNWDKVEPGKRLWPSLFYMIGFKKYDRSSDSSAREESAETKEQDSTDDAA